MVWVLVCLEQNIKSEANPWDLGPKELCMTDTALFVIPSIVLLLSPSIFHSLHHSLSLQPSHSKH